MKETLLQLKGLVPGYPGRPLTPPLSMQLETGARLGIIGGNGSGKSTIMKTLLGLLPPMAGEVCWKKNTSRGYVPQENQVDMLFPLTVNDLMKMGKLGQALDRSFDDVMREMEILPLKQALLRDLSGGEKQRALIGRAWISRPDVLLMDEPFNSLDYRFKEKLWKIFDDWQNNHELTLILIDHDLNRLINQVSHLIVLGPKNTLCGTVQEMMQAETLSQAYGAPLHVHRENGLFQVHFL